MSNSAREKQLATRRANLVARSGRQRARLVRQAEDLGRSLGGVERGIGVARHLTSRPLLLGAAAAALLVFRPARAIKWVTRGALITSVVRRGLNILQENPVILSALRPRRRSHRDDIPFAVD
ncbi:MAG: YqjK family protein [Steroidobacteraceae bacterium]